MGRGTPVEGIRPCWLLSSILVVEASADFPLAQRPDYTGMIRKEHGWSGGGVLWVSSRSKATFQRTGQVYYVYVY